MRVLEDYDGAPYPERIQEAYRSIAAEADVTGSHPALADLVEAVEQAAIDRAIEVLNRIHEADPTVMPGLIGFRVNCNRAVADDPTVQVGTRRSRPRGGRGTYEVGLLGVINGIFGTQAGTEAGYIAAHYDDGGNLTGFVRYDPPEKA